MQPYLVKEIRNDNDEVVHSFIPQVLRTISDRQSLDTLKVYLQGVVDYGTAMQTKLSYIDIAGKTGTAEKIIAGEKTYSKDKYTSLFAGFFPVDEPRYVMVIIFDETDYTYHYASASAVPVFKEVVERVLNHSENFVIADIKESEASYIRMPDILGKSREEVDKILDKQEIQCNYIIKSDCGCVTNQYPQPGVSFNGNEKVIVILDTDKVEQDTAILDYIMPDFTGLTVRRALTLANKKNIKLRIKGHGTIVGQSVASGTKTGFGDICLITAK